jgi:serine/threonine protein kinase
MKQAKPLDRLFNHKKDPSICTVVKGLKNGILIGEGREGAVFYAKDWWSEVVIKRVEDVETSETQVIDDPIEEVYTGHRFSEMLGASLLDSLLDGTNENGFLFQVQRYVGFFTCGRPDTDVQLYLINEKMDGDLKHFFTEFALGKFAEREFKVVLWQSIFVLICLSKLGYYHHDSSPQNFLYRKVQPDEVFLGAEVGSSESWTFQLSDETGFTRKWKLTNVHLVAKTTDFGFLRHLEKPYLFGYQDPNYRVDNKAQGFADVNFFMACLMHTAEGHTRLKKSLMPLLAEWFGLLGIDKHYLDVAYPRAVLLQTGDMLPTLRFPEKHDNWDALSLLEGPYFADILL